VEKYPTLRRKLRFQELEGLSGWLDDSTVEKIYEKFSAKKSFHLNYKL
jgi:hypothetical protein